MLRLSKRTEQLAAALGQRQEILDQVARGEAHPAMVAFGLWRDDAELEGIFTEIERARHADDGL